MFYFCLLIWHHCYFSFLINFSSPSGLSVSSWKVPHLKHVQSFSVLWQHCPHPYSWQTEHESLCEPQFWPPISVGSWEFSAGKCQTLIPQGSQQWVLWFTAQVSQQFLWCGSLDLNDWRALPLWLICVVLLLQVLDNAIETEKMIEKYESLASDLLEWIEQTIIILNNRKFANSLVGVQQQLQAFNTYRTVEKPPKWV